MDKILKLGYETHILSLEAQIKELTEEQDQFMGLSHNPNDEGKIKQAVHYFKRILDLESHRNPCCPTNPAKVLANEALTYVYN